MADLQELKDQQRRQWSGNAPAWDAMYDRLEIETGAVTQWLCREAAIAPGMRVLDLACGSGHPSIDIARLVQPGGNVVATDLTDEMAAIARRRAAEAKLDNIEVRQMDAESIDFADSSFDAVTCRFGIMFCPQPQKALSEVHRVLKPGARLAMSVWDEPQNSPGQAVVGEALARFGRPQPPVDFDSPGAHQLAPPGKLQGLLADAGFAEVRVEPLPLVWEYDTFDALWQRQAGRGPLKTLSEQLPEAELAKLKQTLAEVIQPYTKDGVIRLPVQPLCGTGQK